MLYHDIVSFGLNQQAIEEGSPFSRTHFCLVMVVDRVRYEGWFSGNTEDYVVESTEHTPVQLKAFKLHSKKPE